MESVPNETVPRCRRLKTCYKDKGVTELYYIIKDISSYKQIKVT